MVLNQFFSDMKTSLKSLAIAAIAATAFFSCTEELQTPDETPNTVGAHFSFFAKVFNPDTKATLTPNEGETAFEAAWTATDKVSLYAKSASFEETAVATWNADNGCFEGDFTSNVPTTAESWTYVAKYPYTTDGLIPFGSERVQNGNSYNSAYDVMYGTQTYDNALLGKNNNGGVFVIPMNRLTGIAYFHITGGPNEQVVSATLEAPGIAAANLSIASDGSSVSAVDGNTLDSITITFEENSAPTANDLQLWFNVLPGTYNSLTLTITTATKTATLNASSITYTAGKLNKAVLSSLTWDNAASAVDAGTVLFDEPFAGFDADDVPDAPGTGATIYGSASVSYTCVSGTNGNTKIYNQNTAGGEAPELLVSKNEGSLAISGIPTGLNEKVTVTWNSNNTNIKLFYGGNQETAKDLGSNLYQAVLDVTGSSFDLTFKNTTTSNGRLDNIHVIAGEPVVLEKVKTPTFSPAGGSYDSAQSVTISCETSGATIYYTTGSSEYSAGDWTEYTAAVEVASTSAIKAIAVKDGMTNSDVATASYTISSGTGSGTYYTKVTSVDAIASGNQYVVVGSTDAKNFALPVNPTLSNGKITGTEVAITSNGISDADVDGLLWTLTKSGNNYILSDGNGYLYHAQGGASGTNLGYGNTTSYLWNISVAPDGSKGTFKFAGVNSDGVKDRGMLVTTAGVFGGYALSNITASGYCGIDLYTLSDGKSNADISFSPASATITYGESLTQPTLSNAHGLTVSYASSNTAVATVTANGVISVVGCGEATITCSWDEQTKNSTTYRAGSASFALTVNKIAVTVAFSNPTTAVAVGSTVTNVATVTPSGLALTYESSNTGVATVTSAGVVTGVAKGIATITATYAGDATRASASANYQISVGSANDGSQTKPFTVEEVREYMDASENNRGPVYIQGKVSSVVNAYDQAHGTGVFYISDDGATTSAQFEAYSVKFLGNNAWVNGNTQIAVGDDVIVYGGELTIFNSSIYETKSGSGSYLYSLNGNTSETVPTITKTDITGVAAAGVSGATTTVSFANNDGWTASVTPDGTIVTNASLSGTTITYSVAANTNDARTGSITVTLSKSGRTDAIATISVAQLAGNGNTSVTVSFTGSNSGGMTTTAGAQTGTKDDVTVSITNGVVNGSQIRIYKNATITISAPSGKSITKVEFTCTTSSENYSPYGFPTGNGYSASGNTGTWTGASATVSLTASEYQVRATEIKVTYK